MSCEADDCQTNLPEHYSGKFKGSYAYLTIKDRLPIILVKVIDTLCQNRDKIVETYGKEICEEIKSVIGRLSCLQNEMVTNKPILPICDSLNDCAIWNEFLLKEEKTNDFSPAWFDSSWLYTECYFYRRIKQAFLLSSTLMEYDPFKEQKEELVYSTLDTAVFLSSTLNDTIAELKNCHNESKIFNCFQQYLEVCLWGNKWDLSLSAGKNIEQSNPLTELNELREKILVNNTEAVYQILARAKNLNAQPVTVDLILDNAGLELFGDLCFALFLLTSKLASKINVYPKVMPWFVSDSLDNDIDWLLLTLSQSNHHSLTKISHEIRSRFEAGELTIVKDNFWTLPYDYSEMQTVAPQLYKRLSKSTLVIFKGDLNYRKLTGDRKWEETVSFKKALCGFLPTSVLALRTIKADVIVGLKPNTCENLMKVSQNWKYSGNYALIQCCEKET